MSIKELLLQMQAEYLEELPDKISHLEQLLQKKNIHALEDEFHKLKGTGATYGLPEITEIGRSFEKLIQNKQAEVLQRIPKAIDLLKTCHQMRIKGETPQIQNALDAATQQ